EGGVNMSINVEPKNGVTVYPFDFRRHPQAVVEESYAVSNDGHFVTCFLKLTNDVIISGTHEQHHDINEELFKVKAYQQAIERMEAHGYEVDVKGTQGEEPVEPEPTEPPTEPAPD